MKPLRFTGSRFRVLFDKESSFAKDYYVIEKQIRDAGYSIMDTGYSILDA